MKLKDGYQQIRSNILMMHPLPQMIVPYRMLLQEQKHKQISDLSSSSHDAMDFKADRRRFSDNRGRSNFVNNQLNGRQNTGVKRNLNLFCTHSKMNGYTVDRCYQLYDFPPSFKGGNQNGLPQKRFANMAQGDDNVDDISEQDTITATFTRDQYSKIMNMMGDDSNIEDVKASTQSQPQAQQDEKGSSANFAGSFFEKLREIVLGKLKSGLYCAVDNNIVPSTSQSGDHLATAACSNASSLACTVDDNVKLWHLRLGHMPFSQIR
uniref:GAG-pre-integrase domain-containing protein n=1 Tax=Chenopodium quinoa TaxID=63459 RepID=A0A803L397_CHEQI